MKSTMYCPNCEAERAARVETREQEYTVRGEKVTLRVPLHICTVCGESTVDDAFGDPAEKVFDEYRRRHGLLSPAKIMEIRNRYALSQRSFATLLGMSEATINRYEGGSIQDKPQDQLIRACENPAYVKGLLERDGHKLSDRQRRDCQEALEAIASGSGKRSLITPMARPTFAPSTAGRFTGFSEQDYPHYAAVVLWFCRKLGAVPQTKMNKLVFYTDFLAYRTLARPVTGCAYRRLQYGPVPADYGVLRTLLEEDQYVEIREVFYKNGNTGEEYRIGAKADSIPVKLTAAQLGILQHVAHEFGGMTPKEISERSHKEPAWLETPDRELISYEMAMRLSVSIPSAVPAKRSLTNPPKGKAD